MKKLLTTVLLTILSLSTWAQEFLDGITYTLNDDGTASVEEFYQDDKQYVDYTSIKIEIPSSIDIEYGDYAAYEVTSISDYAFDGCSRLASVTIPSSITSIGTYAFRDCTGLTSITIPNSVISIGDGAFAGCSCLTSISVEAGNTDYDSRDNCNAIIESSSNALISGCENTTIPNGVTSIGNSAFEGCRGLTSIIIPSDVTSIGEKAFEGCI